MRTFRLADADLADLAAGRPSAATLAELRRAQLSRHLLLLQSLGTVPRWYAGPTARRDLADPMFALHTAASVAAGRSGAAPPPDPVVSRRVLTAEHDGLRLRVRLEDTDPLRTRLGLAPAAPLDDDAVAGWQRHLDDAWRLLVDRHRPAAATLAAVLSVVVPVEPDAGAGGISATSAEAYGAVAISTPADGTSLAVGLLHEAQHSVLNAVRTLFDLVHPGSARGYSPWRDDPRPAFGILHGAYAYQAVTRFWRAEAAAGRLAAFEFARWRSAVVEAADGLLGGGALTAAGRRFTGAMRAEVAGWLGDPVDAAVAGLADGANIDHRVRWRLRNLGVDPAAVAAVVRAWRDGDPPPPVPEPALRPAARRELEHSDRLNLVHRVLAEGDPGRRPGGGVRPGDDAYLGGEYGAAVDAYVHDLRTARRGTEISAHEAGVWGGLAVTAGLVALRERPELVRAVWTALDDADVRRVAAWLGRG